MAKNIQENKSIAAESTEKLSEEVGLNLLASGETLRGVYSNVAAVMHTNLDFTIDFLFQTAGQTHLTARVILSPLLITPLINALTTERDKYNEEAKQSKRQLVGKTGRKSK